MSELRRTLGRWDLTAIGINQVIGSAIFLLPADVARLVGPWGPLAFLIIGLLSMCIALCFAEVGSRFDRTGGPYLPARVAFGRFIGFEVSWMMWFTRVTSQASVVNGLALALAFYWAPLAEGWPRILLIGGLTTVLTLVNVAGVKQSSLVVNLLTIGKLLPLALFVVLGLWFVDPANFTPLPAVTREQFGTTALLLIFAYGGYEVTGILAGEAANPQRDVPFAFVMTLAVVATVMTLTSVVATGILPGIAETRTPLADGAALILGGGGALLVSLGSSFSMAGHNMGAILNASRSLFAMAENADLPRWFAHVHPTYRTPVHAILFTSGMALALALSGSFVFLAAVSAVARLVIYLAVSLSTLRLRQQATSDQMGPALFTTPFGIVIPVVASLVSFGILFGATSQQLAAGTAALVAGGVLYAIARRE